MSEALVVIGAGQAAAQLAVSLRQGGYAGPIRLVCDEAYLPYQRPPLSKKFLAEYRNPDSLFLRPESFWRDHDVGFDLGVVIVGGGYIGLEVAAVVGSEGRNVTVLEAEERVLKRVAGPATSAFFDRCHREHGVDIRLGARLTAIEGEAKASAVRLASDEVLPADLVLVAAGARANDDLAAAAGIACHDGILVDEFARTNAPDVYAIGDCTRFPSRRYCRRVRLESVQNAIDQAKAAAASILGKPQPYDPVPWFWSDQYDVKLQIAGLTEGFDAADTVGDPAAAHFSVEYRKGGRLIAVDAVNDARAHMLSRRRIAEETAAVADAT